MIGDVTTGDCADNKNGVNVLFAMILIIRMITIMVIIIINIIIIIIISIIITLIII